ncbi:MAG: uridine kinase [Anaerolineae bacterium]|nr:uridine kinase [Anaerolineae bacterium]
MCIDHPYPTCVAIDGIDAAGKTTLADRLAARLRERGRSVIRASVDSFHNPPDIRHQRGKLSPEGYFYDSFDYEALKSQLLIPLKENRPFQTALFDYRMEDRSASPLQTAAPNAILLFDGVFLLRPELIDHWDMKIFVEISFETSLKRARERDQVLFGSVEEVTKHYELRYLPGQKIYLETCQPREKANLVLDNNDLMNPVIFQK